MMKNNEMDKLTICVKKQKVEDVIKSYEVFGWKVSQQVENSRYDDIVDVSFLRPHYIDNKDELQLQQVYMEKVLNSIGKIEKMANAKTTLFGLVTGLLSVGVIAIGIMLIVQNILAWGIVLASLGGIAIVVFGMCCVKMHIRETYSNNLRKEELTSQLNDILKYVSKLIGGGNEKLK